MVLFSKDHRQVLFNKLKNHDQQFFGPKSSSNRPAVQHVKVRNRKEKVLRNLFLTGVIKIKNNEGNFLRGIVKEKEAYLSNRNISFSIMRDDI